MFSYRTPVVVGGGIGGDVFFVFVFFLTVGIIECYKKHKSPWK